MPRSILTQKKRLLSGLQGCTCCPKEKGGDRHPRAEINPNRWDKAKYYETESPDKKFPTPDTCELHILSIG